MYKRKILIDLDSVLNQYGTDKFDENYIPDIKQGAKEFIEELFKSADLYLFTSRKNKKIKFLVIKFCKLISNCISFTTKNIY